MKQFIPTVFDKSILKKLFRPAQDSSGEDNGQVTIIGGSSLFHGAPILSLKVASRIVDMVFFATPEKSVGQVAAQMKSKLMSFIWVPWEDVEAYVKKSDAVLTGPGFMRFTSEHSANNILQNSDLDASGTLTKEITESFLKKFPEKKWVIDAGSLQTMDADWIPEKAVLTPNKKEFELLFKLKAQMSNVKIMAEKYNCTIVLKGPIAYVCSPNECVEVHGGNAGMTKGGTGDVLAGLTVSLLAKNEPFLAASAASYIAKAAGDELYKRVGTNYNADDLADMIPETLTNLTM